MDLVCHALNTRIAISFQFDHDKPIGISERPNHVHLTMKPRDPNLAVRLGPTR